MFVIKDKLHKIIIASAKDNKDKKIVIDDSSKGNRIDYKA